MWRATNTKASSARFGNTVANRESSYAIPLGMRPLRFGELQGLTAPLKPSVNLAVEQREIEADPEAAPVIKKYLALADVALRLSDRPFLVEQQSGEANQNPGVKRAA